MKIYKVKFKVNEFQSLLAVDEKVHEKRLFSLNGNSKKNEWCNVIDVEIDNQNAPEPDIFCCEASNMVFTEKTMALLDDYLPENIELLCVKWENKIGYVINILEFCDCFDSINSEWLSDMKLFISKYSFIEENVPEKLFFKIKEDRFKVFCCDDEESNSLKSLVKNYGLTGISFELVWDSSK